MAAAGNVASLLCKALLEEGASVNAPGYTDFMDLIGATQRGRMETFI
jgi:hypothetical protein